MAREIAPDGLIVIGENLNATRKIKGGSPRIVRDGARRGLRYTDLSGAERLLDLTDAFPPEPETQATALIPYVGECFRTKDLHYLESAVHAQLRAGAHVIDLCVDEMSPYPEERMEWMSWLVPTVQGMTDAVLSLDSSDPGTSEAGLRVYDRHKTGGRCSTRSPASITPTWPATRRGGRGCRTARTSGSRT